MSNFIEPHKVNCASLTYDDGATLLLAEIREKKLAGHHIDSVNEFQEIGMDQISTQLFRVERSIINERANSPGEENISEIKISVKFTKQTTSKPVCRLEDGRSVPMFPEYARLNDVSYSGDLKLDATAESTAFHKNGAAPQVRRGAVSGYSVGQIPIFVKTRKCNTYGMTDAALLAIGEDPSDVGGITIPKGVEYSLDVVESRVFNKGHIFRNLGHKKEVTRFEFISKPGDAYENSSEHIIRYLLDKNIMVTLTSPTIVKQLDFPFYIIFRLFGIVLDQEIIEMIVFGHSTVDKPDPVSDHMVQVLKAAMLQAPAGDFDDIRHEREQSRLINFIAGLCRDRAVAENPKGAEQVDKYYRSHLLKIMDKFVFPHIGTDENTRQAKMRYLGLAIHNVLKVEMQVAPSSDRDSLKNKRLLSAGQSLAKVFKTQFNLTIIEDTKKKLVNAYKSQPFNAVDPKEQVIAAIKKSKLSEQLNKAITSGDRNLTVSKIRTVTNRLSSEQMTRKNKLNVVSTLRTVKAPNTSAAKQNSRADEMRRVHPSYLGFLCPMQSADTGEQVGMIKQMAISASISSYSSSENLKQKLRADPLIIPFDRLHNKDIHEKNLTNIFVNGDWIGATQYVFLFRRKYIEARRGWKLDCEPVEGSRSLIAAKNYGCKRQAGRENTIIDNTTTIYWNTPLNELNFEVDFGRILRPLLVVRNNTDMDYVGSTEHFNSTFNGKVMPTYTADQVDVGKRKGKAGGGGFVQDVLLTREIAEKVNSGDLTMANLHEMGIIDYISAEEQENCYIAESFENLKAMAYNPLCQYTHCEIPAALYGLPALSSPASDHNQAPRVTFQTNQVKQTCGYASVNHYARMNKHSSLQLYCDSPLVTTVVNYILPPNGCNSIISISDADGYNQEDSVVGDKHAAQRGEHMILQSSFTRDVIEDTNREYMIPDSKKTIDMSRGANYSKLETSTDPKDPRSKYRSIIREKSMVHKNDIIIGKTLRLTTPIDEKHYKDLSVRFSGEESSYVDKVVRGNNTEKDEIVKVKYSSIRISDEGNKFSSRHGQKGEISSCVPSADLRYTSQGIVSNYSMNPNSIPSRQTIGQMMEIPVAKLAALQGSKEDMTVGRPLDSRVVHERLLKRGFSHTGTEIMFSGLTGEWVDTPICIGPLFYQRLQKFAHDEVHSVAIGVKSVITHQPLEGKSRGGGLRLGEMEVDTYGASGKGLCAIEKLIMHSDYHEDYVCNNCFKQMAVNEEKSIYSCKTCEKAGISGAPRKIITTWMAKNFRQEADAAGIGMGYVPEPHLFEKGGMKRSVAVN